MIIQYSDNNENRIEWQHRRGEEWKTAELDELIAAYERKKTGKWERYEFSTNNRWRKCSVCGMGDEYINEFGFVAIRNYCPNCGARMFDDDTNVLGKDWR